ncbi:PAS domain-containing protein [Phenylobacterium sp.]|uniref:PAS domain-containing protein n=1 Tax=Phenylobacterium sp. TaxID=1871053 RepID=UPI0011FB0E85|nr:PAS domain-containing protein [Phenylobacterium sp.]THD63625.1 MAG: PAS domain S-box protein [Phenylobacterium sp.]
MGRLIATHDWSASLGQLSVWRESLKTTVGLMLNSAVPMVLLWGADGIMIYNDAYSVFAAGRHPQILGSKVRQGWPEVADFNDNVMKVGLAGGTLAYKDQELTLYRRGKPEQVWMNLDYSPVIDETGRPGGVIAIVVETTERVLADRRQAESSERQRQQFEQAPGFIIVMSGSDHVVEFVNDTHRRVFGSADWVGKPIRRAFPSIEGQGFFESLDRVYATGEMEEFESAEVRYRRAPAQPEEVRYLTFVYAPIRDAGGAVTGIFCDGFDVTEAHRTTSALRESEARLRELNAELERKVIERTQARGRVWQVTPDLMGALNPEGYFETSNPAWMSVLGWTEDEVAAMSIWELLHPDDLERTREGFALTQIGQPAIRFPNRYRCKDGAYRWISWVGVPEEGMVYCTGRDITEEKAAEAELATAQDALRQSQKMEAVGQLTGGLAHDFNNLLAGITGSLEMLDKRLGEGRLNDVERYITAAQSSARRAAALTQRLLAFSRRQTLDPRPTDLNRLIAGMEELVRRTVGPTVEVEVVGAGGLWLTRVDRSQLENALLNLCLNGRDAMEPQGGRLTIETANKWLDARAARERELQPGQYVSLCVTDTGSGMTPDVIERVFDPFFTTKPLGQGTGLGLSMIYGFVRQSGGQVRIYSEVGKGTTMCLYLPRFAGAAEALEDELPPQVIEPGEGETVLVIDDEPTVRMLIAEVLEENGYAAIEAVDGAAGLKILQSDVRIDLLITDVGLPGGLNGRQVADAARLSRPDLKVLFITGYAENAVIGNGHLDRGMEVITKPFGMANLGAKIRSLIES